MNSLWKTGQRATLNRDGRKGPGLRPRRTRPQSMTRCLKLTKLRGPFFRARFVEHLERIDSNRRRPGISGEYLVFCLKDNNIISCLLNKGLRCGNFRLFGAANRITQSLKRLKENNHLFISIYS